MSLALSELKLAAGPGLVSAILPMYPATLGLAIPVFLSFFKGKGGIEIAGDIPPEFCATVGRANEFNSTNIRIRGKLKIRKSERYALISNTLLCNFMVGFSYTL